MRFIWQFPWRVAVVIVVLTLFLRMIAVMV
jgi:hypothetical protein